MSCGSQKPRSVPALAGNTFDNTLGVHDRIVLRVTQSCTLLYRRIAFCERRILRRYGAAPRPAECNSAIQQIENLRYGQFRPARHARGAT